MKPSFAISSLGATAIFLAGAVAAFGQSPLWTLAPLSGTSEALRKVARVEPTAYGDIVVLTAGQGQGFRPGMACMVVRDGQKVADIVIVRVHEDRSAALILAAGKAPQSGDTVKVKTL